MSIGQSLVAQAGPHMLDRRARTVAGREMSKGCDLALSPGPVALEPAFEPNLLAPAGFHEIAPVDSVQESPPDPADVVRAQVWISPEQEFEWHRAELFIKQLQSVSNRVGYEISGNCERILIALAYHADDEPVVRAAFRGVFDRSELARIERTSMTLLPQEAWADSMFFDYAPPPPYSHLLTCTEELRTSPLESFIAALSEIPSPALGIYQVLTQPVAVDHNWHRNVEVLRDLEFMFKLMGPNALPQRYTQQAPSGDLRQSSWELDRKAHNDKPFFATALRIALVGGGRDGRQRLRALNVLTNMFQHGGRPLQRISEAPYLALLPPDQLRNMFNLGLTYRPGFLTNSAELTGLLHFPPPGILEHRTIPLTTLETLPVRDSAMLHGTPIGTCEQAGRVVQVCIPPGLRREHAHLIGKPGSYKSTTLEHMILGDIHRGAGVAVLDPHGDLVDRLLDLIPESDVERTIYFNPSDREYVPLWNPLRPIPGQDLGRIANDVVGSFKSVVTGWGDRMEHLLRFAFLAMLRLPDGTMMKVAHLLRNKSKKSERLQDRILEVAESDAEREFWREDFPKYTAEQLMPPKNKLSKILLSGPVMEMLAQPESAFDFRRIMDEGRILLVNLANLADGVQEVLGSLMLSLFRQAGVSRSDTPVAQRRQFHLFADESHLFTTDALEHVIAETRKYGVSLTLAHQYRTQFSKEKIDALGCVGTTIIFDVNAKDAAALAHNLRGKVGRDDVVALKRGEAIVRCGTEIVRIRTLPPTPLPIETFKARIIAESRRRYCKPIDELRRARSGAADPRIIIHGSDEVAIDPAEFAYDVFD